MQVSMTVRAEKRLSDQLAIISKHRGMTKNKLIAQVLHQFASKETLVVQEELESALSLLKKYREADPDFEQAIDDVARAELSTGNDPAEGEQVHPEDYETTALVRDLLNG